MYAFSFCLYGPFTPKYYGGLTENLKLISKYYPNWRVFVYVGTDVPESFYSTLGEQVTVFTTIHKGPILMMYRFLAISEPDIECMFVRDADSRIHYRDRWAIGDFLSSSKIAHSIRDHPYHTIPILGGLWGLKRCDISMRDLVSPFLNNEWAFGMDQLFLKDIIYPLVENRILVHTSQTYRYSEGEEQVNFPWLFSEVCYCGKAENFHLLRIFRR
jgi:hypothetical protein